MRVLITKKQLAKRIKELGQELSRHDENNINPLPPVFICVLNGAFMFFTDLVRNYDKTCELDFIRAKSYEGKDNSGGVSITKDIEVDIQGRDIYIVEDIIDTGNTMKELIIHLNQKSPKSIKVVTMLKRKGDDHPIDYCGFEIGDEWVIGFGLDDNGLSRNLPDIYDIN
mgnify:CR=1 FL=1